MYHSGLVMYLSLLLCMYYSYNVHYYTMYIICRKSFMQHSQLLCVINFMPLKHVILYHSECIGCASISRLVDLQCRARMLKYPSCTP